MDTLSSRTGSALVWHTCGRAFESRLVQQVLRFVAALTPCNTWSSGGTVHRVDSVIQSSLREIIGSKNFAFINLSLKFCKTTIYDNKVFLENLVAVH